LRYETLPLWRVCPARGARIFPAGAHRKWFPMLATRPRSALWDAVQKQPGLGGPITLKSLFLMNRLNITTLFLVCMMVALGGCLDNTGSESTEIIEPARSEERRVGKEC